MKTCRLGARRAPATQRHCIFQGCLGTQRIIISLDIRKRVLCDYNYYIPANCRICDEHMNASLWHLLSEPENSTQTFLPEHIEEMIKWFQSSHLSGGLDFKDIDKLNDDHFHYWIGLSREKFNVIVSEVPLINKMPKGQIALFAYLVKLRTGDSDARLSQLFNIPRKTLERNINKVRTLLS